MVGSDPSNRLIKSPLSPIVSSSGIAEQGHLFPRRTTIEYPKLGGSADSFGEADVEDGHYYYLKHDSNGHCTRASEWLASLIAEAVGITVPPAAIIQIENGELLFGSRRIAGVADTVMTWRYLLTSTKNGPPSRLPSLLSSIYAFDMFIFNDDRHFLNYLTVEDGEFRRFYAFDFSRALFWRWPWNSFPDTMTNTRVKARELRDKHNFDFASANATLDKLALLSPDLVKGFISQMPSQWLPEDLKDNFLCLWSGSDRIARVDALRKGISDGSLL